MFGRSYGFPKDRKWLHSVAAMLHLLHSVAVSGVSAVSAVVNSVAAQRAAADKLAMKMLLLEAKARQRASYGTKTELIL